MIALILGSQTHQQNSLMEVKMNRRKIIQHFPYWTGQPAKPQHSSIPWQLLEKSQPTSHNMRALCVGFIQTKCQRPSTSIPFLFLIGKIRKKKSIVNINSSSYFLIKIYKDLGKQNQIGSTFLTNLKRLKETTILT